MSTIRHLERTIQREIEMAIGSEPDFLLLRNSVGHAEYIDEKDGRSFHVPYGLGVGSPDLIGILKTPMGIGAWVCLEVKTEVGELSDEQEKCHRIWRRFGALIFVVRSAADARQALRDARAACSAPRRKGAAA